MITLRSSLFGRNFFFFSLECPSFLQMMVIHAVYVLPDAKGSVGRSLGRLQRADATSENLGGCGLGRKPRSRPPLLWVASLSCPVTPLFLFCPQWEKQAHKRQSFFEDLEHTLRCSRKSNCVNFVLPTRTLRV